MAELISSKKSFGGSVRQYSHESTETKCKMTFSIYLPPNASESNKVPVIYYLAGLTCADDLLFVKAPTAVRAAAERGVAIVTSDTSPRNLNIEGEDESYDFGSGAGFYLDATEPKWKQNYRMYSYVTKELRSLVNANFPVLEDKQSIMGHSMGGHGALVLGIRNPNLYKSISAFAPITHPMQCPWGVKAFTGYLGTEQETWKQYDATELIRSSGPLASTILIDQGSDDNFLQQKQLLPEAFEAACESVKQPLKLRMQEGYDHSYYTIATLIEDHIHHHADVLLK